VVLVRRDAGLGVEAMLCAPEERGQSYLLKPRLNRNVQRYIEKLFRKQDYSELKDGWEGRNGELKLNGRRGEIARSRVRVSHDTHWPQAWRCHAVVVRKLLRCCVRSPPT
jgi:hypothetical protein